MRLVNWSYRVGCLHCAFSDKELCDFVQEKKRKQLSISKKYAVETIGKQRDGTWVLGQDAYFNCTGAAISLEESTFIWISNIFNGPGIAPPSKQCMIKFPLSTAPLINILVELECLMKQNFFPTVTMLGAMNLVLHYSELLDNLKFCPIPLLYSKSSGTGKLAILCPGTGVLRDSARGTYVCTSPKAHTNNVVELQA